MSRLKIKSVAEFLGSVPVIPVLTIRDATKAVPLATALVTAGLTVLEVTLRTDEALEALALIASKVRGVIVGVGSMIDQTQFGVAREAGARFAVSPGATAGLERAAMAADLPWLPAAQSVSEVLSLRGRGHRLVKLFPADLSGGTRFLSALYGPLPDMHFCPTGGVDANSARDYLKLPNVMCVGGSWVAPELLIADGKWDEIHRLASEARQMRAVGQPPLT